VTSFHSKISGYSSFESESNNEKLSKDVQAFDSIEKMKTQLKALENDLKATLTEIDVNYNHLSVPTSIDQPTSDFMSYSTQATNMPKCVYKPEISSIKSKLRKISSYNTDEFLDDLKSELLSNIEHSFDWEDPLCSNISNWNMTLNKKRKTSVTFYETTNRRKNKHVERKISFPNQEYPDCFSSIYTENSSNQLSGNPSTAGLTSHDNVYPIHKKMPLTPVKHQKRPKNLTLPANKKSFQKTEDKLPNRDYSLSASSKNSSGFDDYEEDSTWELLKPSDDSNETALTQLNNTIRRLANVEVVSSINPCEPEKKRVLRRSESKLLSCFQQPCRALHRSQTFSASSKTSKLDEFERSESDISTRL